MDSFPFDSDITLETSLKAGSHCLHNIECTLAWKHGLEMGLEFKTGTRVGLVELQKELNGINKI
ncbi:putative flagellar hook-associated protein2 [Desulfovibrio ferrophilus]|uniref:Putative flagellar hook-associated protein2 n=1 Tax=Desulfovibrio ferrophilus TaxID=241368 RepID=A0A2Z6AVZ2_9BACT|nr:putative flagellar hook-associated protein2 [Desulfovibrio ferrophilus]